ncbi:MAG TPA: RNA polymerase subunit sigma-24 [Flavobacteriales bacterium]|jgi:RNA polymerase sigma-70 factor (ECF subfamily)|nr:RNA polymerase subunit sigma-24 [Flavobacteriales bacterium]
MTNTVAQVSSEFLELKDQLTTYLYRLSANHQDAEDIVQETYLKVIDKSSAFQGKSSYKTWVFAIATNLAKDHQRVKNRWSLDVQDQCKAAAQSNPSNVDRIVGAFSNQTEQKFELEEHINYCFTCVAKNLDIEQQIAIILKEFYQFSRKEIGQILDRTEGVIKHLLYEGRKELQTTYNQRCSLINKKGVCYQCAELNDYLQPEADAEIKISRMGMSPHQSDEQNLNRRFELINQLNPLNSPGAELEDTILQILREAIGEASKVA